ncbi:hypothetical protein [Nocardia sp. NPDC024068]|uniref:hypothetical protein n=1 Tax=Nocardia sp. NPDC024068 TaxID=3157197 RepID=UPI00340CE2F8
MDPVTLIAAAVAAGAAAGATEVSTQVVTDSYQRLKELLVRRYEAVEPEVLELEESPGEPQRRRLLADELGRSGAGADTELRAVAEELLRVLEEQAPQAAAAVGIRLARIEAGGDVEISDITVAGENAVDATDLIVGGSIRISGVRAGGLDEGPPVARG